MEVKPCRKFKRLMFSAVWFDPSKHRRIQFGIHFSGIGRRPSLGRLSDNELRFPKQQETANQ